MDHYAELTMLTIIARRGPSLRKSALILAILVFVAAAALVLGGPGCPASLSTPTVDGWKVGALDTCPMPNFDIVKGEPSPRDCDATLALWLTTAREAFDARNPDHASVVRASLHFNGSSLHYLSPPPEVAVFDLADGTVRAIGVGHAGVDYTRLLAGGYGPGQ